MTTPTPKRDAILAAALESFADDGFGIAVPTIAERAGVGTGTIYRYFTSKEELINVLFVEQKQFLVDRLFAPYPQGITPEERFTMFWSRLETFAHEQPASFRFLELHDHGPYLTAESRDIERELLARLGDRVRELQSEGVFRRDIRAHVLSAIIWGSFVQLHRSARAAHIALDAEDSIQTRNAVWSLCTGTASAPAQ